MNAPIEISIREAFSRFELPEQSPSLVFTGTRGELAAYLIEKDSAHWDCLHYSILDRGPASRRDQNTRHWYVWRD